MRAHRKKREKEHPCPTRGGTEEALTEKDRAAVDRDTHREVLANNDRIDPVASHGEVVSTGREGNASGHAPPRG